MPWLAFVIDDWMGSHCVKPCNTKSKSIIVNAKPKFVVVFIGFVVVAVVAIPVIVVVIGIVIVIIIIIIVIVKESYPKKTKFFL